MSEQLEYTIRRSDRGYVVSGPALSRPSAFTSEAQAVSLARHLIAVKSGGAYITGPDGQRNFYQGSRHLSQSISSGQR
jgi:hypothetical protein